MMLHYGGVKSAGRFQSMPMGEQQALVGKLRGGNVPIRQIARMTGISKGVIKRWVKL